MKLRKLTGVVLAAVMTFSIPLCAHADIIGAGEDPANTEVTDETLHLIFASEPSCLWGAPAGQVEQECQFIQAALMDRLIRVDYMTGEVTPGLATDWEWKDDTHCTFTLRDDAVMTDGSPLVADDVVYSVNVWKDCSPNNDTGRYVVGAEAEDDHTVTIEFKQKAPDIFTMLSWSNFGIASEDEVEAVGGLEAASTNPVVGCGRYVFKEWQNGQSVTLERNENYWDQDYKGYFKNIVIHFTVDAAAREMAVESGDAEAAFSIPVLQATTYGQNEKINSVIYDYGQVAHLWYNMSEGHATADLKVRQAIDKALNFDAIAMVGTGGAAGQSLGYLTSASPYYHETFTEEERAIDLEGAKALMEEAGYGDGLELTILGLQDTVPTYTVIQENLREIGINLTINTPDTATFVQEAFAGNYDLIVVGEYIPNRNPSLFTFFNQTNIDGGHIIGGPKVTTPELDTLLHEIIEEEDNDAAIEKMGEFEQLVKADCMQSNLYPQMNGAVVAKDVKGFSLIERGYPDITTLYRG